jgi:hypothetical protein
MIFLVILKVNSHCGFYKDVGVLAWGFLWLKCNKTYKLGKSGVSKHFKLLRSIPKYKFLKFCIDTIGIKKCLQHLNQQRLCFSREK